MYLLTLIGDGEHRLNPTLLDAIWSAVAEVLSDVSRTGGDSALVNAALRK